VEEDEGETTDLDLDSLQEKDLDDIEDVEFADWIEAVADTERKRKKINQAFAHLTSAKNAIGDDLKEGLEIESLDEIDADVAEEYLPIGKAIAERLIIGDIVFQEGDKPNVVVGEFEQFCEHLKQLIKQTKKKAYLEQKKEEEWEKVEDIEGESIEDKRSQVEQKEEDFKEAERFLKLKEGHCEVCKTEWENLNDERKAEITDRIEEIEGTYDMSLTLDSIEDDIETAQSQQGMLDDVERNLDDLNDRLGDVEIDEHKESLDDLKEKHCSED